MLVWLLSMLCVTGQPSNDECSGAITITSNYTMNNFEATDSSVITSCSTTERSDLWFQYTPSCTGSLILHAAADNSDVLFCVFTGPCTNLTEVQCRDYTLNFPEAIYLLNVSADTPYYVSVSHPDLAIGDIHISAECHAPAPNRVCANAVELTSGVNTLTPNWGATTPERPATSCPTPAYSADLWYVYNAPCTGTVNGSVYSSSDFDMAVVVWDGDCDTLSENFCVDQQLGDQPEVFTFNVNEGQRYFLTVALPNDCVPNYATESCSEYDSNLRNCYWDGVDLTISCNGYERCANTSAHITH